MVKLSLQERLHHPRDRENSANTQQSKQNINQDDRQNYFGLLPSVWTHYEAGNIEAAIRKKKGL